LTDSINAVAAAYGVDPGQFVIAYTAFAAKRLADAPTDQQRAQWADNLVEAAVAARDIIAPIPVPPPSIDPDTQASDTQQFSDEMDRFLMKDFTKGLAQEEEAGGDEDDTGIGALQRLFEKQRNQPE